MTVRSVITDYLETLGPGGVNEGLEGAAAVVHVLQNLPAHTDWIPSSDGRPAHGALVDLAVQRYSPGAPGDVEQLLVRSCTVNITRSNQLVYTDSNGFAVETDGWYATAWSLALPLPLKLPHNEA